MVNDQTYTDRPKGADAKPPGGYYYTGAWYDFAGKNHDKISPSHAALYFYCVHLCNRLGWPAEFGLPAAVAMAMTGIKSFNTYSKTLRELVEFGAIRIVSKSRNQYTATIIALSNFDVALDRANNVAHDTAPDAASVVYINNKPQTEKPINHFIDTGETSVSPSARKFKMGDSDDVNSPGSTKVPTKNETPSNAKFDKNNSAAGAGKGMNPTTTQNPTLEGPDGFETVWTMYGRKGNKKTSLRKWGNLPANARRLALAHIPRYVEATPDIQYRKNFETYLNQEAWNDEIITSTNGSRQLKQNYTDNLSFLTGVRAERKKQYTGTLEGIPNKKYYGESTI